jgi:hypothetical protein
MEGFDAFFDLFWNIIDNYIYVNDTFANIKI